MFFNTRKPITRIIDGVEFVITPLDSYQQIEFLTIVDEISNDLKALPKCVEWVFGNVVADVNGLTDEAGNPVKWGDYTPMELSKGFSIGVLRQIIDAVISTGKIDEVKKKD